jgi:hypothetical protein
VSQTNDVNAERPDSAYRYLDCRTVTEIERRVVKRGKRNPLSRFILAKGDKDKIVAWNQNLVRVLHVFNVRSIGSVGVP